MKTFCPLHGVSLASSLLFLVPWLEENLGTRALVVCPSAWPEEVSHHGAPADAGRCDGGKDAEGASSLRWREGPSAEKGFSFRAQRMRKRRRRLSEKKWYG